MSLTKENSPDGVGTEYPEGFEDGYEQSFDHAWPPSGDEIDRWMDEEERFLALNENDGAILG